MKSMVGVLKNQENIILLTEPIGTANMDIHNMP